MWLALAAICQIVLYLLALRGLRWAYGLFVALGLLYFPVKAGFHLNPQPCQMALDLPSAIQSLQNYAHIVLFAFFFVASRAQFRMGTRPAFLRAAVATVTMGALVEIAQGVTGTRHCRARDLIPDALGIPLGMAIVMTWERYASAGLRVSFVRKVTKLSSQG